ncbi:sigma-70 family RNA polymerase sigma factor [Sporosarcina limicola]|uniref:RNA polymerase sigma-70 factor (ECF subfamily) n=1 Tax=Sporosarcina limicola TaxID=34101 RepID=A0A927MLP7_9BACL|nr:sigma-70 family RNA polymerase sigma factor [Sporosarcina limicola]MBE1556258.1 RNA polymerase sigma-70 factor (ECF subfamily) [Sporosarcina limicola]
MKINEDNVVQQLKQGNEDALNYVIDRYGGLIKSIVNRHLFQFRHMHDECIDDILLGIWNNIESFNSEKNSLKNWIAAISKYKSIDYKRKYIKRLEEQEIEESSVASSLDDGIRGVEKELSLEMESLLSHLKQEDRELFIHYYVDEIDTATLAKELKVEQSVIHNRLSRGRKKLRKLFGNI